MKSKKIWLNINENDYKSDKSFGVNDYVNIDINVGTSATYSKYIGNINIQVIKNDNKIIYKGWFNGMLLFEEIHDLKSRDFENIYDIEKKYNQIQKIVK